jgi:hypothetical protein
MIAGKDTGSLVNHLYSRSAPRTPVVGEGATILGWTDRHAGTVIEVRADGSFVVQEDTVQRVDSNGMSEMQTYEYTPNPAGLTHVFAPVKRGRAKGQLRERGSKDGNGVLLGRRDHYHDFSF